MVREGGLAVLALSALALAAPAHAATAPLPLHSVSVNGDRYADVVLSQQSRHRVEVFLGGRRTIRTRSVGVPRKAFVQDARIFGDFDGDHRADLFVFTPYLHDKRSITLVVVRGAHPFGHVEVARPGPRVIRIKVPRDVAEGIVAPGGDVNGDGLDDLLVGDFDHLWVVFGARSGAAVDVRHLGTRGWTFADPHGQFEFHAILAGLGDVNGDGYDDIGAEKTIILGGPHPPIAARRRIAIAGASTNFSTPIAAAGDLDGDHLADVVITARSRTWVIRGRRHFASSPIRLRQLASIREHSDFPTGLGDFNGDGRSDLLIPDEDNSVGVDFTPRHPYSGRRNLFGLRVVTGASSTVRTGATWAGDVNGDGLADLIGGNRTMYVVFGRRYGGTVDARRPGAGTARLGVGELPE